MKLGFVREREKYFSAGVGANILPNY